MSKPYVFFVEGKVEDHKLWVERNKDETIQNKRMERIFVRRDDNKSQEVTFENSLDGGSAAVGHPVVLVYGSYKKPNYGNVFGFYNRATGNLVYIPNNVSDIIGTGRHWLASILGGILLSYVFVLRQGGDGLAFAIVAFFLMIAIGILMYVLRFMPMRRRLKGKAEAALKKMGIEV